MCGLTGYFYLDDKRESSNLAIREMLALQKHRGPDDSGIVGVNTAKKLLEVGDIEENIAFNINCDLIFGFNRLSILDLSENGHQPMIDPGKKVVLMMNGEVYNAFDYKENLERKGYQFISTSDTEIVLNLYLEYGLDGMLTRLNGMFAIAIYDVDLETLFLARDRFGIKPLYILNEGGRIAFSSEIKSFKALPDFSFEAASERLDEFLMFRNVLNNTLFKNIVNCTPGSYLSIRKNEIKTGVFYDLNSEGNGRIPISTARVSLEKALQKGVESQMMSDVKLGCQLSGGIDSSLVAAYAAETLDKGALETVSITFKDPKFSEEKYIDKVAEELALHSHKFELDISSYFSLIEKAIWHFEQPLNHPNTIGLYLLSQQAKKHVTVLLSGEGSDELLAGYSRFIRSNESPYLSRAFLGLLKRNKSHLTDVFDYYTNANKRMVMGNSFGNLTIAHALKQNFKLENALHDRIQLLERLKGDSILRQRKYEMLTFLPDLLMRQDKMSMAHSVENRVPFLDNAMVSSSLNMPGELLIGKHRGKKTAKKVLKEISTSKFGEDFSYRDKMGFSIPFRPFFSSKEFKDKWENLIAPGIQKRGLFKLKGVSLWVKNVNKATTQQLDAIWLMLNYELWAQQFLDK